MTDREAMQQALEALNRSDYLGWQLNIPIIKSLRERLAHCERCGKKLGGPDDIHTCSPQQPEQEPAQQPVQEPVYWEVRCTAHPKWMRVDEQQFDEYLAHGWEGQRLYTSPSQRKPEQEPVAWRTFDGEGNYDFRDYDMNENYDKEWAERNPTYAHWVEPLYTNPPQRKPEQQPIKESSVTHSHLWIGDLYGKEKNT